MATLSKKFGKLTIWLLVLVAISFSALPALGQYGGGSGTAEDPYLIYTPGEMYRIGGSLFDYDKHFRLMANIDLSGYTGTSFFIIGIYPDYPFTGVFDGDGHTISNFTYTSTGTDNIGIFGYVDGPSAEIKDLGLINPSVDAGNGNRVGSLVGQMEDGIITKCYVEGGSVSGDSKVGGLAGSNGGTISNCYAEGGSVSGDWGFGGLVGSSSGIITKCSVEGVSVSGRGFAGGLAGSSYGVILDCHASGSVSAAGSDIRVVGGLVGDNGGTIANCYSQVSVSASDSTVFGTGGLVALNNGDISNSYATGSVSGVDRVGGLVGYNRYAAVVNCYSTGSVTGVTEVGGLVGLNDGMVSASFWDKQSSGRINMCGSVGGSGSGCDDGNGKTTAEMEDINTFLSAGWDFVGEYTNGPSDDWAGPGRGGDI